MPVDLCSISNANKLDFFWVYGGRKEHRGCDLRPETRPLQQIKQKLKQLGHRGSRWPRNSNTYFWAISTKSPIVSAIIAGLYSYRTQETFRRFYLEHIEAGTVEFF